MDKSKISKWCYLKIIGPGLAFFGSGFALLGLKRALIGNLPPIEGPTCHIAPLGNWTPTIIEGPTCHMPAIAGPGDPDWWFQSPLGIVILVTIGIAIIFGAVLLYRQIKRNRVLKAQYEKGIISEEDYKKMK